MSCSHIYHLPGVFSPLISFINSLCSHLSTTVSQLSNKELNILRIDLVINQVAHGPRPVRMYWDK